jgi:hypothetical protein
MWRGIYSAGPEGYGVNCLAGGCLDVVVGIVVA